ncbi:phage tail tape measure protein [Pseudomonas amygdali pv. eriobotryae]|uniref:Phage tail tape measure protein n=1 Tax=Pseudomonas amygdali pv. eriobotryae TaxID=129137 RepID=A0A9P3AJH7_PSEA0|nr:phage tail length tape measure family protein [Pseudomonas amygdali]GFZ62926.1 phage tail tape measure protein [Pseudomonas amygdali pv. eriobotryae]
MAVDSLGQLTVDLIANTGGFEAGMDRAQRSLKSTTKEAAYQGNQLDSLLGKIDPIVGAYGRLDKMEEQLRAHRKANRLDETDFTDYLNKLNAQRDALSRTDDVVRKTGVTAAQTTAAFRQLPAQITDIFTSLAGGQNPLMVLIQQGGQIKDAFGGVGPTLDAFGAKIKSAFTGAAPIGVEAVGAALGGIAVNGKAAAEGADAAGASLGGMAEGANTAADAAKNAKEAASALGAAGVPVSGGMGLVLGASVAAAAAVAALAYAYKLASDETTGYQTALIMTGNTAGTSAQQLSSIAQAVSEVNGTVHEASATLSLLAGSTKIPVSAFEMIAKSAANMEDATDKATKDTVADFEKLAKDPLKNSVALTQSLNYLTAGTYEQIAALEKQGDTQGAATVAFKAYSEAIDERSAKIKANLGTLEGAWKDVMDAAKGAGDAMIEAFRDPSIDKQIAETKKLLEGRKTGFLSGLFDENDSSTRFLEDKLKLLIKARDASAEQSKEEGRQAQIRAKGNEAFAQFQKDQEANWSKTKKMNEALEKAQQRITAAREGGHKITAEEEEATYKAIRDNSAYKEADPKPYREDAGTKMLDQARQQYAVLQEQSKLIGAQVGEQQKLGAASQDLIQWEQQLADIKGKKTLTADQQSLLAVADQITAQKKLSADLEVQNALRTKRLEQEQKLAAFAMSVSDSLAQNQQRLSNDVAGIGMGDKQADRLQEDLRIRQDYAKQIEKLRRDQQNNGTSKQLLDDETGLLQKALETRLQQQADYYAKVDEAQQNWSLGASAALQNYVNDAQNYSAQAADFVSGSLSDATNGLGDLFADVATGAEDAGDAIADFASNMGKSVINALTDMAAQWLIYQGIQLLVGKSGQSAAATGLIANAQAASAQAALNAYASTAGIPLIGPELAPAAALAATAATTPMVAAVSASALAGMAHNGMDNIPKEGTWLLDGGERVLNPNQNRDLTKYLADKSGGAGGGGSPISISVPVTVQGQPGMSDAEAASQGRAIGESAAQQVRQVLQQEMRQGGLLWRRT